MVVLQKKKYVTKNITFIHPGIKKKVSIVNIFIIITAVIIGP